MRSTIFVYILSECPGGEMIGELASRFSSLEVAGNGDLVKRAIGELIRERLLCIDGGKVVPARSVIAG